MVPILINEDVFEPIYDLKLRVQTTVTFAPIWYHNNLLIILDNL